MTGPQIHPLRVLVLADAGLGHTERYVGELIRQGCDVAMASLEVGEYEYLRLKRRGPFRWLHYPLAIPQLKRAVTAFHPDVINPHFASGYGFLAAMMRSSVNVPIVLQLLGSDVLIAPQKSWIHRRKVHTALSAADVVLGDSAYLCDEAEKVAHLKERNVIPWGIEEKFLTLAETRRAIGAPLKVLVPRPHEPVYNNDFLLRNLEPLITNNSIALTFPSFGRYSRSFIDRARDWYGDRIGFYNRKSREKFIQFMAGFDVYLSASKSDSSPVSLIEAMGLGLVPIVGDIPGVWEWMKPDRGFLFDLNDPHALLSALGDLIQGKHDLDRMRQRNLQQVKAHGVFEQNIAATIEFLRRASEGGRVG